MRVLHIAFAAVVGAGLVLVSATPASAHGVEGVQPSNYQTRVLQISPRIEGVTVRAVDLGNRLEIENRTRRDVIVPGYEGEPYLRIGPRGVFENRRSPAVVLNRDRYGQTPTPDVPDSKGPPSWRRVSSSSTAAWHDHRSHWMGSSRPSIVDRDPEQARVLQRFAIDLQWGGREVTVRGDVRWVPGPSPWPALAAALGLALLVIAMSRTRWWQQSLFVALFALTVLEAIHVAGLFGATTASSSRTLSASIFAIGGVIIGVVGMVWLVRSGGVVAIPMVLLASVVLTIAGGLADITTIWSSQIPSTLSNALVRVSVTGNLGLGIGLIVAAALRLRLPGTPRRHRRSRTPLGIVKPAA